jgi:hypothetical protein
MERNASAAGGMLGHFPAGFTLDTYAHVTTSVQKETAQTVENALRMLGQLHNKIEKP